MKTRNLVMALAVILLVLAGCREKPITRVEKIIIPVEELARYGYFTLQESNEKGSYGPVVIFPERHNSRLIQAEFGWALNILLEKRGMNTIALEGMFEGEIMTTEKIEYGSETEKYEAWLAVLERGDIKAPEFMYFVRDAFVFGIENEEEYNVKLSAKANLAFFQSLLISIALDQGNELLESYLESAGEDFNLDTLFKLNPWTHETNQIISKGRSLTRTKERISELEVKTGNLMDARTRAGFREFKEYHNITLKRSYTMAGNVYARLRDNNEPLAMIIGAAHTEDITAYFDKNNISYYVMEPRGLNAAGIRSDLTRGEYERKNGGASVLENKEISQFFDEAHNSRPTHAKYWVRQQVNFVLLVRGFVNAFASSPPPHNNFSSNILERGELRITEVFHEISSASDIKFSIENSRGERVYVRAVKNSRNNEFVNLQMAFRNMIERLSQIDEDNMSYEQKMSVYAAVIEVFKLSDFTIFMSPRPETLFMIDPTEI